MQNEVILCSRHNEGAATSVNYKLYLLFGTETDCLEDDFLQKHNQKTLETKYKNEIITSMEKETTNSQKLYL